MTDEGGKASCLHCRATIDPTHVYCDRCGRSTRVDVRVHAPVEDPRRRYEVARQVFDRHRAVVGDFESLSAALRAGRGALAESLLPADAQPIIELLQAQGVACGLVTAGRGRRRGGRALLLTPLAVALVVAATGGGLLAVGLLQRLVGFSGLAASGDAPPAQSPRAALQVAAPPADPSAGATSADSAQPSAVS